MANNNKGYLLGGILLVVVGTSLYFVVKAMKKNAEQPNAEPNVPKPNVSQQNVQTPSASAQQPSQSNPFGAFLNKILFGTDLTKKGTYIPTSQEFQDWRKNNPLNLQLPTFKRNVSLSIGEQVPSSTLSQQAKIRFIIKILTNQKTK